MHSPQPQPFNIRCGGWGESLRASLVPKLTSLEPDNLESVRRTNFWCVVIHLISIYFHEVGPLIVSSQIQSTIFSRLSRIRKEVVNNMCLGRDLRYFEFPIKCKTKMEGQMIPRESQGWTPRILEICKWPRDWLRLRRGCVGIFSHCRREDPWVSVQLIGVVFVTR